jgi:hypothetical protein
MGVVGSAVCSYAIVAASFWLLCLGMFLMGSYTAFGKYYRFAAADAAQPSFRAKAISLTLAGGLVGGVIGPELAKYTRTSVVDYTYLGSYISLGVVCLLAMLILTRLDIPKLTEEELKDSGRPLGEIMRQPVFIVAAMSAMLSYGIMNLMMTSTPLAMHAHEHHFNDAAFVLQWHMIGMYAPSFFTGSLIQRFGVLNVIVVGIMFLLGVGWNFMYVGGSALLTECHTPAERAKTQAANDFMVFATMAISSMSSGLLLNKNGWSAVNYGTIPFLLLATAATFWLMWQRRAAAVAAPTPSDRP